MFRFHPVIPLALLVVLAPQALMAQTAALKTPALTPIRGAHYPALSPDGKQLCFEYQGDLWTVSSEGGKAARLTVHRAYDAYPRWSPDGHWIAFSSNREGNYDIFLIPARGGEARQITFHSASDIVTDWSPDGTQILFTSAREGRFPDLYTIRLKDGRLRRITNDQTAAWYGAFAPDGKAVVYARGRQSWTRPRYRGSANNELYAIPANGGKTTRLTKYDGWDSWPLCAPDGRTLYFVSDRDGTSNLWRMPLPDGARSSVPGVQAVHLAPAAPTPEQITRHKGDAVRFPTLACNGSRLAYEYNFEIWTLSLNTTSPSARTPEHPAPIKIYAPSDRLENAVQRLTLNAGAASLSLSPDGKTLAFAARGEIWTVPAEGGDATRLTTNGSAEYAPAWSSDSTKLAFVTDRHSNLDIYLIDVKTRRQKQVTTDPADDINPQFSEDGRFLAYVRTGGAESGLYVVPLPTGDALMSEAKNLAAEAVRVGPGPGIGSYDWSPDGNWLAYSKRDPTSTFDLWIVPSVGGTPINVTRYPGFNSSPQWSRDGKQILFLSNRGGPPGFAPANIYRLPLLPPPLKDDDSPGASRSGAETEPEGDPLDPLPGFQEAQRPRRMPPASEEAPPIAAGPGLPPLRIPPRATNVQIEFEDIHHRAVAVTNSRDPLGGVTLSPDARTAIFTRTVDGQAAWWAVDTETGSTTRIAAGGPTGQNLRFAPDGSKFFFLGPNGAIYQMARGTPAPTPVAFNAVMDLDRRVETAAAFKEAWRRLKNEFYDPQMHGADWAALRAKYEPLLAETVAKEDFAWLLSAMIGELNASHLGVTPAADPGPTTTTGYLGLTFDQDYTGPGLKVTDVVPKGPGDQMGRRIMPGDYVLALDGAEVAWNETLHKALRDKAGRNVELFVNSRPDKEGARTVKVKPITKGELDDLEYERWVQTRRKKVEALSNGQLAYLHIRSMNQESLRRFERELFGDAQSKRGLVLDVRFNGGGRIHDDLFALLNRRPHGYEVPRDSDRSTQPFQLWDRPSVLLINEYSSSDAEIFPNGFRHYGLGKLVGVPTYGGVIGTTNVTLIDGTTFRIPRTGWYTVDGRNMENWGVPPDILVEQTPEDNAADNDRQLETAVRVLLDQMAKR